MLVITLKNKEIIEIITPDGEVIELYVKRWAKLTRVGITADKKFKINRTGLFKDDPNSNRERVKDKKLDLARWFAVNSEGPILPNSFKMPAENDDVHD